MIWCQKISGYVKQIEATLKSGKDASKFRWYSLYSNPPKLVPSDYKMIEHYDRISTDRGASLSGAVRISWTSLNEYAKEMGYTGRSRRNFVDMLMAADAKIVNYSNSADAKRERKKKAEADERESNLKAKMVGYQERWKEMQDGTNG